MEPVGVKLKKIRLEKGISLEEVQKKTKIHLNILKALEGDSLTDLRPVYLKGFLKIYCKFLGLDPQDFIADYRETKIKAVDVTGPKDASGKPGSSLRYSVTPATFLKSATLGSFRTVTKKIKTPFVFILITVFLMLGLYNLGKTISSKRKSHLTQDRQQYLPKPSKKDKKKEQQPQKILKPADTTGRKSGQQIRLGIRVRENCWLSIKVDGRVVFQRVLEKGRFESWQAKDRIELSVGNAGAVELEINGQLFSNLGRRGQVRKNILITKEGLNIGR